MGHGEGEVSNWEDRGEQTRRAGGKMAGAFKRDVKVFSQSLSIFEKKLCFLNFPLGSSAFSGGAEEPRSTAETDCGAGATGLLSALPSS